MTATLFLVVGASGAGKDALIDAARAARPGLSYPQRVVTRRASAAGEAHHGVDAGAFARMEAEGRFALAWQAHGHAYGIPRSLIDDLEGGRDAVVNASRGVVDRAQAVWGKVRVIEVDAPADVRAARLVARERESPDEIVRRLSRDGAPLDARLDITVVDNGGSLESATTAFLAALDRQPVRG